VGVVAGMRRRVDEAGVIGEVVWGVGGVIRWRR